MHTLARRDTAPLRVLLAIGLCAAVCLGCKGDEKGSTQQKLDELIGEGMKLPTSARAEAKGCDEGRMRSCTDLGIQIENSTATDFEGEEKDAFCFPHQLFSRACEAKDPKGCFELSKHFVHGVCTEKDLRIARGMLAFACRENYRPACELRDALNAN